MSKTSGVTNGPKMDIINNGNNYPYNNYPYRYQIPTSNAPVANHIPIVPHVPITLSAPVTAANTSIIPTSYNASSVIRPVEQTPPNGMSSYFPSFGKKVNLQICKYNNARGSFNTSIDVPGGFYPTLYSLVAKVSMIAQTHQIIEYDLYYRYGQRGTKFSLSNDIEFSNINWYDERLLFNIVEKKPVVSISAVGNKRKNEESDNQPKKKSKYEKTNEERKTAEIKLTAELSEELKSKMTRADMVSAACLHASNPELWTVEKLEEFFRDKKKDKTSNKRIQQINGTDYSQTLLQIQGTLMNLQDKMTKLEEKFAKSSN